MRCRKVASIHNALRSQDRRVDPRAEGGAYRAVLLANHGPVVSGKDLFSAVCAAEELEETAKLLLALRGYDIRLLSIEQVEELKKTFGDK